MFPTSLLFSPASQDPQELVRQLESCLKLNEAHQEQYRLTKAKLQQTPRGKQFDFCETEIFGAISRGYPLKQARAPVVVESCLESPTTPRAARA